jgi:glycosyltransferase involved in cell wall biosynthesis
MTSTFYPAQGVGGDALHVKWLAEALVQRGHQVHVLYSQDAHTVQNKGFPAGSDFNGVNVHSLKTVIERTTYSAYLFGSEPSVNKKFKYMVKQINPDVVHHHNISLLGYGILKKRAKYVNLYTAHDYWLICQGNKLLLSNSTTCKERYCFTCALRQKKVPQLWRKSSSFLKALKTLDLCISPCQYLNNKLIKLCVNSIVLPNFVPPPSPSPIRPPYGDFFLFAGVLEKHKGIMQLVRLWVTLKDKTPSKLLIVGQGSLYAELERYITANGLNGKVVLLGWVDRPLLHSLLQYSKALIMPSIWPENCPLIALEAISYGTPVLANNLGGLPEIINQIDEDLVFSSWDQLSTKILNFNAARYQRSKLHSYYKNSYSPEAYVERYLCLLEAACNSSNN